MVATAELEEPAESEDWGRIRRTAAQAGPAEAPEQVATEPRERTASPELP